MAKFVRCGEDMLVNIDTINTIKFDPHSEFVLSIHTNDPKMLLLYTNSPYDRKSIRNFIDDIRSYFTLVDQAPGFWELLYDIEKWLDEREADKNG